MAELKQRPLRSQPDFGRDLHCLFGLPFDAIGLHETVQRVRADAFAGRRCSLITSNLNIAVAARREPGFADMVSRGDLNVPDGMPMVWIARLLGLPIRERVAGSDLFDALQKHSGPPLSVFMFGGPPGAAAAACNRINDQGGGLRCVGFDEPGFCSVEDMSAPSQIDRINASGAQFLVVALGARKGQEWIERNAERLVAPVISHLGAVVNFAAGTVRRAPRWMRRFGLEWLWRIKEEPTLWRRYSGDGARALVLLVTSVGPYAVASRAGRSETASATLVIRETAQGTTLEMSGSWRGCDLSELRVALARCQDREVPVTIDLSSAAAIDAAAVGLLLVASGWLRRSQGFNVVVAANERIVRSIRGMAAEHLLLDGR